MKMLGVAGSPRRGGNTDVLLAEMLAGAESKGAETKTIRLNDMTIAPCQHCDACLKKGECKIQDDMQSVYRDFEEADVIVLASPIQFMGITAPMKAMMDRFQSRWARKYVLKTPPLGDTKERKGYLIAIGGTKLKNLFEPTLIMVKTFFRILAIDYAGELLFREMDERGAAQKHPDALRLARLAGEKLAEGQLPDPQE